MTQSVWPPSRHFKGKKANHKVVFEFKAYGHDAVRKTLNKIFAFKCAYCESFYGATAPVAIEHYRPKGEVVEGKKRLRGYYWLAASWENLFPSCTDCNSRRTQSPADGVEEVRGKGNLCPLADPKKRAKGPKSSLANEGALLLDPSSEDPADEPALHLEFIAEPNKLGLVRSALVGGKDSPKGQASILVYALDRPELIEFRQRYARHFLFQCRNTEKALLRHQANPGDAALKQEYEENLAELRSYLDPGQSYVGMVRQLSARRYPTLQL